MGWLGVVGLCIVGLLEDRGKVQDPVGSLLAVGHSLTFPRPFIDE